VGPRSGSWFGLITRAAAVAASLCGTALSAGAAPAAVDAQASAVAAPITVVAPDSVAAPTARTALSAAAQDTLLAIELRSPAVVRVRPGELVRAVFRLTNLSDRAISVWTHAELPRDWELGAGKRGARLAVGASEVHVVAMQVPEDAPAGRYTIPYDAVAGWPTGPQCRDTVVVEVAEIRSLALTLVDAPRLVEAGTVYEASFIVANRGNVRTGVELYANGSRRFPVRLDATSFTLDRGESRVVRARVETDARLQASLRNAVTLRARAVPVADSGVLATGPGAGKAAPHADRPAPDAEKAADAPVVSATSVVEVVAAGGRSDGESLRFPVRLGIRGGWPMERVSPLELSGRGPLTRDGAITLDLLLRGPGTTETSPFGERDEYRVQIRGKSFDIHLGDRYYDPRLLTMSGRYAFGVGGSIARGFLEMGGFAAADRRYGTGFAQQAAFVGLGRGESHFRLHYGNLAGTGGGVTWTGQGRLAPLPGVSLAAEYGVVGEAGAGGRPDARALELRATRSRVALHARHSRVDAAYPGLYRGTSTDYASLSVNPWRELSLRAWVNRSGQRVISGREDDARTNAVELGYGGLATLTLRETHRTGSFASSPYDRQERSARLRVGVDLRGVALAPQIEIGNTEDLLTGATSDLRRYTLRASWRLAGGSYSVWTDRFRGRQPYAARGQAWLLAGAQAFVPIGDQIRVRLSVSSRRDDDSGRWGPTVLDLGIDYNLPFGHSIESRARSVESGSYPAPDRTDAIVEYGIPFAIPIPTRGGGRVVGRVFDAETGAGLEGVLVRLGDRAVLTDDEGVAEFSGVQPGTQILTLDRLGAGIDRVPLKQMPLRLDVAEDEATRVEIGLARGARLTGTVRRFAQESVFQQAGDLELVDVGGAANVLVQVSSDGEVHRRLTDSRGAFDFGLLRPGRWTLEVRPLDLPPNHEVETPVSTIELAPGQAREVSLRIVPVRRTIRIVDRAEIAPTPQPPNGRGGVPAPALPAVARPDTAPRGVEPAHAADPTVSRYTVQVDDIGLMDIARKVYGDVSLWPKLWLANRVAIADPDVVRVGQVIVVPRSGPLTAEERAARDGYYRGRIPAPNLYTVHDDDRSLMNIARKVYGDASLWVKIWVANRAVIEDPDRIHPGEVLYIPERAPLTGEELEALEQYRRGRTR